MTASNAVFNGVKELSSKFGDTTDYIDEDMGGKEFPFIYIGESMHSDLPYREGVGEVTQTVHIYATRKQREHADYILKGLSLGLRFDVKAEGYVLQYPNVSYVTLDLVEGSQQIIHHVIEYNITYTRK